MQNYAEQRYGKHVPEIGLFDKRPYQNHDQEKRINQDRAAVQDHPFAAVKMVQEYIAYKQSE
jgi:hypothetical protein